MERDLVRISERSQELGRPYLYATTRRFLSLFGLHDLGELPRATSISTAPVVAGPPLIVADQDSTEAASPSGQEAPLEYTVEDEPSSETRW